MGQRTVARKQKPTGQAVRPHRADAAGLSAEVLATLRSLGAQMAGGDIIRLQAASRLLLSRDQAVQKDATTFLGSEPWAAYLRGVLGVGQIDRRTAFEVAGWFSTGRSTQELRAALLGAGRPREMERFEESLVTLCGMKSGTLLGSSFGPAVSLASECSTDTLMQVLVTCGGEVPHSTIDVEEALQGICAHMARIGVARRDEIALSWGRYRQSLKRKGSDALVYESVRVADRLLVTSVLMGRTASTALRDHPFPLTVATARILAAAESMDVSELPDPAYVSTPVELEVRRWWVDLAARLPGELTAADSESVAAVTTAAWVSWLHGEFELAFQLTARLHLEMAVTLPCVFALLPLDVALLVRSDRDRQGLISLAVAQLLSDRTLPWQSVTTRLHALVGTVPASYWPFPAERTGAGRTRDRAAMLVERAIAEGADVHDLLGLVVAEYSARGAVPSERREPVRPVREEVATVDEAAVERPVTVLEQGPRDMDEVDAVLEWLSYSNSASDRVQFAAWCISDGAVSVLGDTGVLSQLLTLRTEVDISKLRAVVQRTLWSCIGTHRFSSAIEAAQELHVLTAEEVGAVEAEHLSRSQNAAAVETTSSSAATPVRVVFVGGNETQAAYVPYIEGVLNEKYGGRVTVTWVDQTWGSNWHIVAERVDRLLSDADVVCLMTFVRTALGGRVRKLSKAHGVPWVAVTGHGRAALIGSIHEAVGVVDRLRVRAVTG